LVNVVDDEEYDSNLSASFLEPANSTTMEHLEEGLQEAERTEEASELKKATGDGTVRI
jgi:hypothetical protein